MKQVFHPSLHVLQMGPWPINSLALGASKECFLLMKNEIRNLSLNLRPGYWIERGVAKEAPGEGLPRIHFDLSFLNELFQLEQRLIFCNSEDHIFRSSWNEFSVSSYNDPSFLTAQSYQWVDILSSIIKGIVSQHSQLLY